jgi:hypothetical protein
LEQQPHLLLRIYPYVQAPAGPSRFEKLWWQLYCTRYNPNISDYRNCNDDGTFLMAGDEVMTVADISLSAITENVVAYIAGFVIRKMIQKLRCEICTMALYAGDDNDLPELKLIKLKTNGNKVIQ